MEKHWNSTLFPSNIYFTCGYMREESKVLKYHVAMLLQEVNYLYVDRTIIINNVE